MKILATLIFAVSLLFALEEVPRIETRSSDEPENKQETPSKTIAPQDQFHDSDSNSVNDQREDDFQIIKSLNSKFKIPVNLVHPEEPDKKKEEKKPKNETEKKSPEKTKPNAK